MREPFSSSSWHDQERKLLADLDLCWSLVHRSDLIIHSPCNKEKVWDMTGQAVGVRLSEYLTSWEVQARIS